MSKYNPSDVGKKGNIFGLPYTEEDADLLLVPVNLDVTVSYHEGTCRAPDIILDESSQLDLSIPNIEKPWELKMAMPKGLIANEENNHFRKQATEIIAGLESDDEIDFGKLAAVNDFCDEVHRRIESTCDDLLNQGKFVAIVGGDHSSPLGLIRALAKRANFGILQIDAHLDLRNSYQGFDYSHASIMCNSLKLDQVVSLTSVGIRDFCEEEENFTNDCKKGIHIFYDELSFEEKIDGKSWKEQVDKILDSLPEEVYISFDIDGLLPSLCPTTGTPVPGGLSFNEATYLLNQVVKSGKKIVGFDLCEVGATSWDANVGARILYRLAISLGLSQNLINFR